MKKTPISIKKVTKSAVKKAELPKKVLKTAKKVGKIVKKSLPSNTSVKKTSKMSTKTKIAIGVGAVALGAGAYALLGPKGKKNQKELVDWTAHLKKEVEIRLKKIKKTAQPVYTDILDTLATTYATQYTEHAPEIIRVAKNIKKELGLAKIQKNKKTNNK